MLAVIVGDRGEATLCVCACVRACTHAHTRVLMIGRAEFEGQEKLGR